MHILIVTDGTLEPDRVADALQRWYQEGDRVTVFTAMNIPAETLDHLGDAGVKKAAAIALEAGQGFTAGDRAAERLAPSASAHIRQPIESPMLKALTRSAKDRTEPVVQALAKRNIPSESNWTTTNNRTARSILTAISFHKTELLVMGSHGKGRFEGLLGSTGTKLVRHSPASVLMIRNSG